MVIKVIHYDYVLECGHEAIAELTWFTKRDSKEPIAWHVNDMVKCQPCNYEMRKIVDERKKVEEE